MNKKVGLILIVLIVFSIVLISKRSLCSGNQTSPKRQNTIKMIKGDDFLIVPGKRVGIIELGENIDRLESLIGKGEIAPRKDFQIFSFKQFLIDLGVQKDMILMILVMNPRYRTQEGVRVTEGISLAIRNFGRNYEYEEIKAPDVDYIIQYWEKGITFSIKKEIITKIKIFNQNLTIKQMNK